MKSPILYINMASYQKDTSHSVNFEGLQVSFELIFTKENIINDLELSFLFFESQINDASSNASASLDVPLSYFQDVFQIRMDPLDTNISSLEYFVDESKWSNHFIKQEHVAFSDAIVQPYDGDLNRGPVDPSHCIQSIKRDMLRHIYNSIPNAALLDDLQQFQLRVLRMIENTDICFHTKIKSELQHITDLGYQSYQDTSFNPLRTLIGSTYDEYNVNELYEDQLDLSGDKIATVTNTILSAIDAHNQDVKQYGYYVVDVSNMFHGPLFMDKVTALDVASELTRSVSVSNELVDGLPLVEISFNHLDSYMFYGISGNAYTNGSYDKYGSLASLETNQSALISINRWKENFAEYAQYMTMAYPFVPGDQLSLLIEYSGTYLESLFPMNGQSIDGRTYQVFLTFT